MPGKLARKALAGHTFVAGNNAKPKLKSSLLSAGAIACPSQPSPSPAVTPCRLVEARVMDAVQGWLRYVCDGCNDEV